MVRIAKDFPIPGGPTAIHLESPTGTIRMTRPREVIAELEGIEARHLRSARQRMVHDVHDITAKQNVNAVNSLFTRRPMNEWLQDAARKPAPRKICGDIWVEGELAIGFGGTGEGKTAFGVQVGNDNATGKSSTGLAVESSQGVLYIDFELSDSQQLRRYAEEQRNGDGRVWYVNVFQ